MKLRYTGPDRVLSVNGRPLKTGAIIDDPREVADLKDHPQFEAIKPPKPPKARKPKAEE